VVVRERSLSGRWRTTSRTLIVVRLVACGEEMGSRAHPLIGPAHRSRGRWIDPADCSALAQRSCTRPSVPALVWETGQGWTVNTGQSGTLRGQRLNECVQMTRGA